MSTPGALLANLRSAPGPQAAHEPQTTAEKRRSMQVLSWKIGVGLVVAFGLVILTVLVVSSATQTRAVTAFPALVNGSTLTCPCSQGERGPIGGQVSPSELCVGALN
jgi:hypothetical protein